MTLRAESSQSECHVTKIIQNFTLVSLTFTTMPHRVWLPFGALDLFLDQGTQLFFTLHTQPLTIYVTELAGHLCGMIRSGIICRLYTCWGMRLDHPQMSLSGEERPVSWTQPDLLSCAVISLVISIGQDILTRWRRPDTSKARLDGTGLWGLSETIGPNICTRLERFWNDWELGRVGLPWSPR